MLISVWPDVHASLRSPGDGESGARARLAFRTPSVTTSRRQAAKCAANDAAAANSHYLPGAGPKNRQSGAPLPRVTSAMNCYGRRRTLWLRLHSTSGRAPDADADPTRSIPNLRTIVRSNQEQRTARAAPITVASWLIVQVILKLQAETLGPHRPGRGFPTVCQSWQ
jgi:hypothetical protein